VALVTYALVTLAETTTALKAAGSSADTELEGLIQLVTEEIEHSLGCQIVGTRSTGSDPDITENHDFEVSQGFLYSRRRPIRSVSSLALAGSALTVTTDYVYDSDSGLFTLVGSSTAKPSSPLGGRSAFNNWPEDAWRFASRWFSGITGATLVYKGGYAATTNVPGPLKLLALDMIARVYRERERKSQGMSSEQAQGFTVFVKYALAEMRAELEERLRPYRTHTTTARR
jgi:hypothetical protein